MFTSLFVMGSAVVGGTLTVSYAARAVMEAGLALARGKTVIKETPLSTERQEHYTPPSLKLAAKTFAEEITVPIAAMSIGVEEMCRSARDVFIETRRGAYHLLQKTKRTSAPADIDGVATPSVPVTPSNHETAAESTLNLQPA